MNAILGFATNLSYEDVAVFAASARDTMPEESTRIVLWVDERDEESLRNLSDKFALELHLVKNPCGAKPSSLLKKGFWNLRNLLRYSLRTALLRSPCDRRLAKRLMMPVASRYIFFLEYLDGNTEISKVFMTDVRDVVFQRNIFERIKSDRLYVAQEHGLVAENKKASRWCRTFLTRQIARELMPKRLHCVGTILGDRGACLKFLRAYEREILKLRIVFWGADTAIFLHIVFNLYPSECIYSINNDNDDVVYTGSRSIDDSFPKRNSRGDTFAAIHMYDRNEELARKIRARYLVRERAGDSSIANSDP